jgi:hypothetical protein
VKKLAVAAALLAVACARKPATNSEAPPNFPPNLLTLTRGASVVSRTGEAVLGTSPVRALDADDTTIWVNPPGNLQQTLVFSLPARARVEQLGMTTSSKKINHVQRARFELSEDGEHFVDAGTFTFESKRGPQLHRITPANALYVGVTTLEGDASSYLQINDIYAAGALLAAPGNASIAGCWAVNGEQLVFDESGSGYAAGALDTFLQGGSDGRFYRFAWIRGRTPEYGLAAISVAPDGKHLGGIVWHEEAIQAPQFFADDWLADRGECGLERKPPNTVMDAYLKRFGYFPLYALRFDDNGRFLGPESALDQIARVMSAQPVRFVAHELIQPNPDQVSKTKLDTLRAALAKRGVDVARAEWIPMGAREPRREAKIDLTRAMYNTVEIQIQR